MHRIVGWLHDRCRHSFRQIPQQQQTAAGLGLLLHYSSASERSPANFTNVVDLVTTARRHCRSFLTLDEAINCYRIRVGRAVGWVGGRMTTKMSSLNNSARSPPSGLSQAKRRVCQLENRRKHYYVCHYSGRII